MLINSIENELCENTLDSQSNDNEYSEILCIHCKRTKENGIRCLGICVADNDY